MTDPDRQGLVGTLGAPAAISCFSGDIKRGMKESSRHKRDDQCESDERLQYEVKADIFSISDMPASPNGPSAA